MNRIVCNCHRKTLGEIIETVHEKKCTTVEKIGKEIGAGTGCGRCIPFLERIIEIETNR